MRPRPPRRTDQAPLTDWPVADRRAPKPPSPPSHTHRRSTGRPAGAQGCGARPQPHVRARARSSSRARDPTGRMRFDGEIFPAGKRARTATKSGFSSSGSIFRIAESISNPDWTPPETDVIQVECPWNPVRGPSDARHPDRAAGGAAGTALVWSRRYANSSRGTECISKTVVCICYAFMYTYISEADLLRSESAVWFGRDVRTYERARAGR